MPRLLVYMAAAVFSGFVFSIGAFLYSQFTSNFSSNSSNGSMLRQATDTSNKTAQTNLEKSPPHPNIERRNRSDSASANTTTSSDTNKKIEWKSLRIGREYIRIGKTGNIIRVDLIFANTEYAPMKVLIDSSEVTQIYIPGTTSKWHLEPVHGIRACSFKSECKTAEEKEALSLTISPRSTFVISLETTDPDLPDVGTTVNVRLAIAALSIGSVVNKDTWGGNLLWEPDVPIIELSN